MVFPVIINGTGSLSDQLWECCTISYDTGTLSDAAPAFSTDAALVFYQHYYRALRTRATYQAKQPTRRPSDLGV